MALFRGCSSLVIRCFKRVEALADWVTGAAGPWFVGLCWVLIVAGGVFFFDVIGRELSWATTIVLSPILILVPLNLYVQYYLAANVPPGYPSPRALAKSPRPLPTEREERFLNLSSGSWLSPERWGLVRDVGRSGKVHNGWRGSNDFHEPEEVNIHDENRRRGAGGRKRVRRCRKCDGPKPERTHHCSVCKRCVLLMDHHCPWINGCVGLHNQRHFVLFMAWLSLACWTVCALGYESFWRSINFDADWPAMSPRIGFTLLYVLSIAIGVAVPILCSWHLFMVTKGETSIEAHDNAYLEGRAKGEGLIYLNPFDLGRRRNLQLFFNVGPGGYPYTTLLLPLVVPAYTNGWSYPRRALPASDHPKIQLHEPGLADGLISIENGQNHDSALNGESQGAVGRSGKYVMGGDGELTDDEEGGGGWMDWDDGE